MTGKKKYWGYFLSIAVLGIERYDIMNFQFSSYIFYGLAILLFSLALWSSLSGVQISIFGKETRWGDGLKALFIFMVLVSVTLGFLYWNSINHKILKWEGEPKIAIIDKHFRKERVFLDGHSYSNCTFEHVTLVYNGTGPFDLIRCSFVGTPNVDTSANPSLGAIARLINLLHDFGIKPKFVTK